MTRPLQRRKNRSSLPRVRQKPPSKKRLNIKSNPIVAANWNSKLTLSQNYRRLGLSSKLNSSSGGVEKSAAQDVGESGKTAGGRKKEGEEPLNITSAVKKKLEPGSVRVVRDSEGRIVTVVREGQGGKGVGWGGQWGQPLNEDSDDDDDGGEEGEEEEEEEDDDDEQRDIAAKGIGIVPELEEASRLEKKPRPRKQSQREVEWIEKLVGRWGKDVAAMARDRKLNPMQQTKGDLRKRVQAWQKSRRSASGDTMDVG